MLTNCFYQPIHLPTLPLSVVDKGMNADYQLPPEHPNDNTTPRTTNPVAISTFANSKFAQDVSEKLNTKIESHYVKFSPYTLYDWHTDIRKGRTCAINFLLNEVPKSLTLFRQPVSHLNYNIIECKYTLQKPMVFNVKKSHCIINNSDQFRYLLSITLVNIMFDDAVEFFKTYNIDSYI
jgi:hypothetical protein